jgi:hypothetical protein
MKKIISGIFLMTTLFCAASLKAQTADEIVNKYVDAIGGKDKIKQITSVYLEGSVQVMGNENPTTVTILNGKGYKSESDFNGQKAIQCYTDKGGWAVNPMGGGAAEPMPDEQYKAGKEQIDVGGALFDYAAKGSTVELQGKDAGAYKLKLVSKDKVETTYFIDPSTYYLVKMLKKGNMMGQEIEITIKLSDYKKTDFGNIMPFTIDTDLGQFSLSTTIKKAEINKAVDPSIFIMPK